jgi:putative sigma-54 modulation protein
MKIEYLAKSYALDEQARHYTEEKLKKLLKFLDEPVEAHVTMETEKHHFVADLVVNHRFGTLQARETADQMLDAINLAVDKLETQAERARKKFKDRRRRAQRQETNGHQWPIDVIDRDSVSGGGTRRVILKSSLLHIKPMSIEEAALALDGSEHDFVVFRDSETDRVSVLYKRRDSNYGLIAPEF